MAQRSRGERVLGPYPIGRQWRVVVVGAGGERDSRFYPTKEKAEEIIRSVRKEFAKQGRKTMQEALDAYEEYLSTDKQNKAVSVANTMYRLETFFSDKDMMLGDLTPRACESYYEELRKRNTRTKKVFSVDSHRTILAAAKTFLRWCCAKPRRWVSRSPVEEVQGFGKRKHGKPQLRIDEARKWVAKATEMAGRGESGAVAALVVAADGDEGVGDRDEGRARSRRRREAALDTRREDRGGEADPTGAGGVAAVPARGSRRGRHRRRSSSEITGGTG